MHTYPIGKPGTPWGEQEKAAWLNTQNKKRSYFDDVLPALRTLPIEFEAEQYGALNYQETYPLYVIKNRDFNAHLPTVLITGGVHGYESSGVHGALAFVKEAAHFLHQVNFIIAPCISPWGYETINRWNPDAVDPNRSFATNSKAGESAQIMAYLEKLGITPLCHIDLHETTDTDNSEFRPAKAARDGTTNTNWNIPDGFYLVADERRPELEFQKAMIAAVSKVTHIAPADDDGKLIGVPLSTEGVITYDAKPLGLCMGMTDAPFVTTTEVYPDSPDANDAICNAAQVACIKGALAYLTAQKVI